MSAGADFSRSCAGGGACTVKRVRGKRRTGPEQAEEEEGI